MTKSGCSGSIKKAHDRLCVHMYLFRKFYGYCTPVGVKARPKYKATYTEWKN